MVLIKFISWDGLLPWEMVVSPAQKLAEDGFILDRTLAKSLGIYKNLSRDSVSKKVFVKDKDYFQVGEIFKQPDLAKTH